MERVRRRKLVLMPLVAAMTILAVSPVNAHEEHRRQREAALKAAQMRQATAAARAERVPQRAAPDPTAAHAEMGEMMEMPKVDRSRMSYSARFLDWLGRWHPILVHFPIAFFPAALFTAVVGRRRPAFAKPVQFLVVAGGIIAPIAALLGWLDGGFNLAADDWLLSYHRWLGTGIGLGAAALAIWAIRKPQQDRGMGMILGLAAMTAAIVIQGWFGGALVHGMAHMDW